jgi:hypothetical protein
MFRRTMLALSVVALLSGTTTFAQENATLILRSGERLTGRLFDHARVGFSMRLNNGEERVVPTNDVAIVDFTGKAMTDADWDKVNEGKHVLWLTSGQTVTGHFADIGGTTPLIITWKGDEGERDYSSREIARIVLARTDQAVAATTGTPATLPAEVPTAAMGGGIVIGGDQPWVSTGIAVRRGEWITFNTSGQIRLTTDAADVASAAGSAANRTAANAQLPATPIGALIGRIGNRAPFAIGNRTRVQMPASGVLFLGINDDHHADNAGELRVEIQGGRVR